MKQLFLVLGAIALLGPRPAPAQMNFETDIYLARFANPDSLTLDEASIRNVTTHPGYDNQPQFTPDSRSLLYSTVREGQTEIFCLDLEAGTSRPLTRTEDSEFSPCVLPDGSGISAVRVEPDSSQRLWKFPWVAEGKPGAPTGGEPTPILELERRVGYYAWVDSARVALFVLGLPNTLRMGNLRDGTTKLAASDIGRSMHKIPGKNAVSFVQIEGGTLWIKEYDLASGEIRTLAPAIRGAEDYAWTPDGHMLMAQGTVLSIWDPRGEGAWRVIQGLGGILPGRISRLAVSPDGTQLAMVVDQPAAP